MPTPIKDLEFGTDPIPTAETWPEYENEYFGGHAPSCYLAATYNMLEKIEPILLLEDFGEMKTMLTNLYEERYAFVAEAIKYVP